MDLVKPSEIPKGCTFIKEDILHVGMGYNFVQSPIRVVGDWEFDFIVASPPCENFSVHGMKHFFPNPPYPELGIKLFNHTRRLCEASGVPYVIENVRAAQQFVGNAVQRVGPFYLWGNGVPPLVMQGVKKNYRSNGTAWKSLEHLPKRERRLAMSKWDREHFSTKKHIAASQVATIPPEVANCVADYAERLLEQRCSTPTESNPSPSTTSAV